MAIFINYASCKQ